MKYRIAIPTYGRYNTICAQTLAVLYKCGIKRTIIDIFVAPEEYNIYKSTLDTKMYNNIIIGKKGLMNQRNYIMKYYNAGDYIVQMDDDIDDIVILRTHMKLNMNTKMNMKGGKLDKLSHKIESLKQLDKFIKLAFQMCKKYSYFLWGIYPVANPFFMTPTIRNDLRFIVGPLWGCIIRHNTDIHSTMNEKENVERTLQYYTLDGGMLRFDFISIKTKYYKNKGGMQQNNKTKRIANSKISTELLHATYPSLTKIKIRKNGRYEIVLLPPKIHIKHTYKAISSIN